VALATGRLYDIFTTRHIQEEQLHRQQGFVKGVQPWSFASSLQYDVTVVGAGIVFGNLALLELTRKRISH